ncbi:hypothetical protein LC613_35030 [Nostoc sphaeroides CHAB 2801]|uniref:hypothetical protein n=1 Tax=Nostoc sphaeroides TaxID=446679 RepID=UPI001E4F6423|nr:hypothetical protein [Nostoc sphaeroides]MCC5632784.1 hypothetical protein [Nostoc sphaeroides CHAB 2801]
MSGQHPQYLKQWVLNPPAETVEIRLPRQDEEEPAVGKGFEVELGKFWLNEETNKWVRWHERYLVVYSQSLAASIIRGQQQRILTARTALDKLAAKPGEESEGTYPESRKHSPALSCQRFFLNHYYRRNTCDNSQL